MGCGELAPTAFRCQRLSFGKRPCDIFEVCLIHDPPCQAVWRLLKHLGKLLHQPGTARIRRVNWLAVGLESLNHFKEDLLLYGMCSANSAEALPHL